MTGQVLGTTAVAVTDPEIAAVLEAAVGSVSLHGITLEASLRHLPGRRQTFLASRRGTPVVVKAFVSPRARGNARRLRALADAGVADLVPRSLAVDPDGHVGVVSWVDGAVLDTVDDRLFVASAHSVGAALARLHGSGAQLDRAWTWYDETSQLRRRMPDSVADLVERVAVDLAPAPLVPSHRDLHPRQVVLDSAGAVHLIDLDDAAMAPPGLDVGNMVAHLRREGVVGGRAREVVDAAVTGFLAGYGVPPADLPVWERAALARLAGLAVSRHHDEAQRDALVGLLPARAATTRLVPTGHVQRPVSLEERDGERVVVKHYLAADGSAVHDAMEALWERSGLGSDGAARMPRPLAFDVATSALTMGFLPGEQLAVRGDLGGALEHAEQAAALLADLHGSGVVVDRRRTLPRLLRSAARKAQDVPPETRAAFRRVLDAVEERAARQPPSPELVLSHGDFSPRNVLVHDGHLSLIDFDRLQMAPRARDLTYWQAWLWSTATMAGQDTDVAWTLGEPLVTAYCDLVPDGVGDPSSWGVYRALALLRIAHGWSALRSDAAATGRVLEEAARQVT